MLIIFTVTCLRETVLKPCLGAQLSLCATMMLTMKVSACFLLFQFFLLGRAWLAFEWCVSGRRDIFTSGISCSFAFKHFDAVLCGTEEIWQIFVLDYSLLFYFSSVAFLITLFLYPQPTPSSFARPPCLVAAYSCTCQGFGLESFIPLIDEFYPFIFNTTIFSWFCHFRLLKILCLSDYMPHATWVCIFTHMYIHLGCLRPVCGLAVTYSFY